MQKLTAAHFKQKHLIESALAEASNQIRAEVLGINTFLAAASERMENLIEHYNGLVGEAGLFIDSIHDAQEAYISGRSDTWVEGDKGYAYQEWASAWTEELETIEVEVPGQMDEPDLTAADSFTDLPLLP